MSSPALFTSSDLLTVRRAAALAERLTADHFRFGHVEWTRRPYRLFTRKEVGESLESGAAFAHLVQCEPRHRESSSRKQRACFGVVLMDPNILRAVLRSSQEDLWTLSLFIMTHELIHIVRFDRKEADFHATGRDRDDEERIVYGITGEILSGAANTELLTRRYEHIV
jgi:hypothetical protein